MIVIKMIDLSETGMSLSRRMILVPWSSWRCATAVVLVFGSTRDALVKIFDQKIFSQKVRVITPGCQKRTTKGSDYDGWVSISFLYR